MAFNFTQLAEMMNPQAPQPAPMAQQAAAQQAAAELEFQQMLAKIREHQEAQRQAQLAETSQQFDPIIERMRGNVETATQPVPQGSRLGDLGEIIANAFYTARFNERLKTPYERRQAEAGTRQQQEMNALAQMRLMMEGKSKAEDRISQSFDDRTKAEMDAAAKLWKARQDAEKAARAAQQRDRGLDISQARLEDTRKRTGIMEGRAEDDIGNQADVLVQQKYPHLKKGSAEYVARHAEEYKAIAHTRRGPQWLTRNVVDAGGNPATQMLQKPTASISVTPTQQSKDLAVPTKQLGGQARPSIPAPAPSANASPKPLVDQRTLQSTSEVPNTNTKSWWVRKNIVDGAPQVRYNSGKQYASESGSQFKEKELYQSQVAINHSMLSAVSRIIEKGGAEYFSPANPRNIIDLLAAPVSEPGVPASWYDQVKSVWESVMSPDPGGKNSLPPQVRDLVIDLRANLNNAIKQQTGAAGSFQEYKRISLTQPSEGDSLYELSRKFMKNQVASALNLAFMDVYTMGKGRLSDRQLESFRGYHEAVSEKLAASLLAGNLSGAELEEAVKPETLIEGALLYSQAKERGPEFAEQTLADMLRGIEAIQKKKATIIDTVNEKNPPPAPKFGQFK
jgi:hypothetical protein